MINSLFAPQQMLQPTNVIDQYNLAQQNAAKNALNQIQVQYLPAQMQAQAQMNRMKAMMEYQHALQYGQQAALPGGGSQTVYSVVPTQGGYVRVNNMTGETSPLVDPTTGNAMLPIPRNGMMGMGMMGNYSVGPNGVTYTGPQNTIPSSVQPTQPATSGSSVQQQGAAQNSQTMPAINGGGGGGNVTVTPAQSNSNTGFNAGQTNTAVGQTVMLPGSNSRQSMAGGVLQNTATGDAVSIPTSKEDSKIQQRLIGINLADPQLVKNLKSVIPYIGMHNAPARAFNEFGTAVIPNYQNQPYAEYKSAMETGIPGSAESMTNTYALNSTEGNVAKMQGMIEPEENESKEQYFTRISNYIAGEMVQQNSLDKLLKGGIPLQGGVNTNDLITPLATQIRAQLAQAVGDPDLIKEFGTPKSPNSTATAVNSAATAGGSGPTIDVTSGANAQPQLTGKLDQKNNTLNQYQASAANPVAQVANGTEAPLADQSWTSPLKDPNFDTAHIRALIANDPRAKGMTPDQIVAMARKNGVK